MRGKRDSCFDDIQDSAQNGVNQGGSCWGLVRLHMTVTYGET